jgi:hypothetical protein
VRGSGAAHCSADPSRPSHILDKLGAANRTEAVARARDLGLLG